ncbi:MAG: CtsR family transcriptional regulator [Clostridiaceae bacterium]|nr:CtsR family transcriptional regulator [Clostridiaceae bacterium]
MSKVSEMIENFIKQMLMFAEGETIDIQRNELANQFGCSPSHINYVISTRFTSDHGYIIESRRGGSGFIRITKMRLEQPDYIMHIVGAIGESITFKQATTFINGCVENGAITKREHQIIKAAISDKTLINTGIHTDKLRAKILKNMLLYLY